MSPVAALAWIFGIVFVGLICLIGFWPTIGLFAFMIISCFGDKK